MEINLGVKAATYPNGEKLSDVMTWNHYGTETILPRPVLRIAAENTISRADIKDIIAAFVIEVLKYPPDAENLEKEALRKIGMQIIKEAKRIINAVTELKKNAPSTIMKKGFNQPLFETGEIMIKNLGFEISEVTE